MSFSSCKYEEEKEISQESFHFGYTGNEGYLGRDAEEQADTWLGIQEKSAGHRKILLAHGW